MRQAVLTPNGSQMIYIERQAEDAGGGRADLVTWDTQTGTELGRYRFSDLGDRIVSFDGERVVIARQMADATAPRTVVVFHLETGKSILGS